MSETGVHLQDLQPVTANCQALAKAWTTWRGDKLLPCRSDMNLEDIVEILPYICLADALSEKEIIFRLAGTMVAETLGVEMTGRNLLDLTAPEHRAKRGIRTMQNATLPCGAVWIWEIAFVGRNTRSAENLCLPVQPDEPGAPMQLLSVFGFLEAKHLPVAKNHIQYLASSDHHAFIDIGAGVPDPD